MEIRDSTPRPLHTSYSCGPSTPGGVNFPPWPRHNCRKILCGVPSGPVGITVRLSEGYRGALCGCDPTCKIPDTTLSSVVLASHERGRPPGGPDQVLHVICIFRYWVGTIVLYGRMGIEMCVILRRPRHLTLGLQADSFLLKTPQFPAAAIPFSCCNAKGRVPLGPSRFRFARSVRRHFYKGNTMN